MATSLIFRDVGINSYYAAVSQIKDPKETAGHGPYLGLTEVPMCLLCLCILQRTLVKSALMDEIELKRRRIETPSQGQTEKINPKK